MGLQNLFLISAGVADVIVLLLLILGIISANGDRERNACYIILAIVLINMFAIFM